MKCMFWNGYSFPGFAFILFCITACQNPTWDNQADTLHQQSLLLSRQQQLLNEQLDSLWDSTTQALEAKLTDNIPPVDRDIFLKSRNADHIRMFASFSLLDTSVQSLINRAGEYDKMIANQMRDLHQQQLLLDREKNQFLTAVAKESQQAFLKYSGKLQGTQQDSQ